MNKAAMAVRPQQVQKAFPKDRCQHHLFKGMYRDLTDTSVVLKLWNGKKWIWVLRTYRTPLPQESSDPFTNTGP